MSQRKQGDNRAEKPNEVMPLSVRDRDVFVTALLNAPAPTPRLRKTAERYKQHQHRSASIQGI